jgi:aminotransferase
MGGVPVRVPVYEINGFSLRPEDVEERITSSTKIVIINSPNNPTGAVMSCLDQEHLAKIIIEHGLLAISDEVYCELIYDGRRHSSIASIEGMQERTLVINSFSKTFAMTGWRIGFAAGPAHIIAKMIFLQENLVACPSAPGQYAALHALETMCGVEEMRKAYQRRRDILVGGLNDNGRIKCAVPAGAFYAFPNITETGFTSGQLADVFLKDAGVVVIPGNVFGKNGEGYLRMSYAVSETLLRKALLRINRILL